MAKSVALTDFTPAGWPILGHAVMEPISIVIPAYNELDCCRQCIQSIQANTERSHRLVLVNNGSTDGIAEYFDGVPGATVIHNTHNLGFAAAVNQGIRASQGNIVLLNSDTIVPKGWLPRLERALLSAKDIGMAGAVTNEASGPQRIDAPPMNSMDDINAFALERAANMAGKTTDTARLIGFCLLIHAKVISKTGLFDERFGLGNCEDDDYSLRVITDGFRLVIAQDTFIFHYGSRTFRAMGLEGQAYQEALERNVSLLFEKWSKDSEDPSLAHEYALILNRQAREALHGGDVKRALFILTQAIRAFPELALNHNDLGAALWEMGEHERARRAFGKALEMDPDFEDARLNLRDAENYPEPNRETLPGTGS